MGANVGVPYRRRGIAACLARVPAAQIPAAGKVPEFPAVFIETPIPA